MNEQTSDPLAIALFSEVIASEQLIKGRLNRSLPKDMDLSHFILLNFLNRQGTEKSPAQLAKTFHLTKGAMTNTLSKLEAKGFLHIRPDWDDARRKQVTISDAGRTACKEAERAIAPILREVMNRIGVDAVKAGLPMLRELRIALA